MPKKGPKRTEDKRSNSEEERSQRREAFFQEQFLEDLRYWVENDRSTALRTLELVDAVLRDPFVGIGKPEPLKHLGSNVCSRRITQAHRIVYLVRNTRIDFLQASFHY